MIVDASAVIAILQDEPEAEVFAEMIATGPSSISAANWLEAAMVASGERFRATTAEFDAHVEALGLEIEPVTAQQVRVARGAFNRYGKGSGSAARLNFGDCLAYALSATTGEPLLFKGEDFAHTDVLRAPDG